MRKISLLMLLGAVLLGCGSDEGSATSMDPIDDMPDTMDDMTLQAQTDFYIGTSQVSGPDGTPFGPASPVVIKRTRDPKASTITEIVDSFGQGGKPTRYELVEKVEGSKFTASMKDDNGSLKVEGTLDGEPWKWTSWHSKSTYVDGMYAGGYITSDDVDDGTVVKTDKSFFAPDATLQVKIHEENTRSDETAYTKALGQITQAQ